ncbi:MAG: NosD domain-containing protein [Methanobacteriota archaeon]
MAHGVSGGSGNASNPWIIENWEINGNGYGYCIYIGNTTNNFVIRNLYLHDAYGTDNWPWFFDVGLTFYGVQNGKIDNNSLSSNSYGIHFLYSNSNKIANNTFLNNYIDIHIDESNGNIINNNVASSISLSGSDSNTISYNSVSGNGAIGIAVYYSNGNIISDNIVTNNNVGISIDSSSNIVFNNNVSNNDIDIYVYESSSGNTIYHNNFTSNQAYGYGTNQWDNGYPSGGNYWGDYSGVDYCRGFDQSIPGCDGIGDTPYLNILGGAGARDRYPIMQPWGAPLPQYIKIPVVTGWNLISVPMEIPTFNLYTQLMDGDTYFDRVMWYDSADMQDHWKQYNPFWNPSLNDLTRVEPYMGFWIYIGLVGDGYLNVSGLMAPSTQIQLRAGWNLVGYPTLAAGVTVATAFWGTSADIVEVFDAGAPYMTTTVGPSYVMKPGRGYWVHVPADTVWTVDW